MGFGARNLASVDGQIVLALSEGPLQASEIYASVNASQPTVSRRLGYLLSQCVVTMRHTPDDRRCNVYSLNPLSMWNGVDLADIRDFGRLAYLISRDLGCEGPDEKCCDSVEKAA